VRRIAEVADIEPGSLVMEIGPGLGVLTRELASRAARVIAIELDNRLAEHLEGQDLGKHVTIVRGDVLRIDLAQITSGKPFQVVANLPYAVATAAIEHLLDTASRPTRLVIMVQREVAERMVAKPPNMSILAVAIQFYGIPKIAFRVGSGAFIPPPNVESAVVRIDVRESMLLPESDHRGLFTVVRAGFGQRRKNLLNALSAGLALDKESIRSALDEASIDTARRAETLTIDEWVQVYQVFSTLDLIHAGI
jgi:16S rRNA (adenine1518-N6/adenine1519-N6)-dimethyltransferase